MPFVKLLGMKNSLRIRAQKVLFFSYRKSPKSIFAGLIYLREK